MIVLAFLRDGKVLTVVLRATKPSLKSLPVRRRFFGTGAFAGDPSSSWTYQGSDVQPHGCV